MIKSLYPSALRRPTIQLPINPAPPVTIITTKTPFSSLDRGIQKFADFLANRRAQINKVLFFIYALLGFGKMKNDRAGPGINHLSFHGKHFFIFKRNDFL